MSTVLKILWDSADKKETNDEKLKIQMQISWDNVPPNPKWDIWKC